MANNTPTLDLIFLDTHSDKLLAIGDSSFYPSTFSISTPTLAITPPAFPTISLPFVANSVQVYNSITLGITTGTDCDSIALPDGIYRVRYSVYPAYRYYVDKTFIRVDKIMGRMDDVWLRLDIMQCDGQIKYQQEQALKLAEDYINGAIAAANNCANKLAMELYTKASNIINKFQNNSCSLSNSLIGM